jgi:YHS domain-containing protein
MEAIDPVCKMMVTKDRAPATVAYMGTIYCFCSLGCKHAFEEDPEAYLRDE